MYVAEEFRQEYRAWLGAKSRCYNPKTPHFHNYGGRGIYMADEWRHNFKRFYADMGPQPVGKSLDRIDNNGPYGPGNCRWATHLEQCRNTRANRRLTFNGLTQTATDWADHVGLRKTTLMERLYKGWTVERALTTPVGRYRQKVKGQTLGQMAPALGLGRHSIRMRLHRGWSLRRATTTPNLAKKH